MFPEHADQKPSSVRNQEQEPPPASSWCSRALVGSCWRPRSGSRRWSEEPGGGWRDQQQQSGTRR